MSLKPTTARKEHPMATLIGDLLLQVYGVRLSAAGDGLLHMMEGKNAGAGKVLVRVSGEGCAENGVPVTPDEARYFAQKLIELADRVERKARAKAPCCECGK